MDFYHVLSRGIEGRKIFLDKKDYLRFVHDLYEFNDEDARNASRSFSMPESGKQSNGVRHPYFVDGRVGVRERPRKARKLLVNLHAFTIMPNHYHLLISPVVENGIPLFIKKLNGGYANYFNKKYKRKGHLYERKYKSILIEDEAHFIHLPYYIHCNPLDLKMPEWRKRKIENYREAMKFLENYRWSSHVDYLGKKNFPSVTQREFLLEYFGGEDGYGKEMQNWLKSFDDELDGKIMLEDESTK